MRRLSILLIGVVATLGFAPAPVFRENPRDPKYVLDRLQGTWTMSRYEQDGQPMISAGEVCTVKIEKDQWTTFRSQNGGSLTKTATFTLRLDPKAAPAEIDFIQSNTDSLLGVYDLKGDTLKIVVRTNNAAAKGRARDLANPTPNDCILQLERTKP